jgi:hypothetical protein
MPAIYKFKCNKCSLTLPTGWGYCFYVENDKGKRIDCLHPSEDKGAEQVLGEKPSLELVLERTGFNSFCICLDCLYQFKADLGVFEGYWTPYGAGLYESKQQKDKRECPKCKSKNVKTELEIVGNTCPKCKEGTIEQIWTWAVS